MSNDIFATDNGTTPAVDPNKNYLEELVGEGKKFKSPEDLARGKAESDLYIATLRQKLAEHEQELNARKKIEDIVATIVPKSSTAEPTNPPVTQPEGDRTVQPDHLTPEKLEELIERRLSERERANRANTNLSTVIEDLKKTFGPNYAQTVEEKGREVGLSREDMNELAKRAPEAFFRLVGSQAPQKGPEPFAPPRSTVNPTAAAGGGHTARNKAFYDDMKKRDPALYNSPSNQNQMMTDALRLKEAFFV